jgi:hypothetical protein
MIRAILTHLRERSARKRLDRLVRATRESYATEDYRRRRAAQLKGERRARFLAANGRVSGG